MGFGGWLVAGTCEDAILGEKLEAGDLVEYFGYHERESVGAVLRRVLDANYVKSGPWVRIDVIACESEYYSWWLNEKTNPGWYHLCAQKKQVRTARMYIQCALADSIPSNLPEEQVESACRATRALRMVLRWYAMST